MKASDRIKSSAPAYLNESIGTSRICEWQTLARIADQIQVGSYCSVGCDGGADFLSLRENYRKIPAIGFDDQEPDPENLYDGVEWYQVDESEEDLVHMHDILAGFLKQNENLGPTLFYVNNRMKLSTLGQLVCFVRPGSVIGTHDWGVGPMTIAGATYTEVPESRCGFIYEAGLQVYMPIEPWITRHNCIQKFWIKK